MKKSSALLLLIVLVNCLSARLSHGTCSDTCFRIYAVIEYANNVGICWKNDDGWLETAKYSNDFGTTCVGDGAVVKLVRIGGVNSCGVINPNGIYVASTTGNPDNVTKDVTPCSVCQVGS